MIPKVIHCFWAKGPKTKLAEKCLASWRRFAPDWEIREWHLDNLPVALPTFAHDAVAAGKWAMVSDWARMAVLHEFGGLYLDLDVELIAPISNLPLGEWVAGEFTASGGEWLNPGAGIQLEKDSRIAAEMLRRYAVLPFDSKREMMRWINRNLSEIGGFTRLPAEVMSPIGVDGKMHRTERTIGIHHYAMSWASPKQKILQWLSWHGFRPVIDALLKVKRALKGAE